MGALLTAVSGWLLVVLLAATIALPYLLRSGMALPGVGELTPLVDRMRPHVWLGYSLGPLTVVHLWPSMSEGWARSLDPAGLDLATAALALILVQVWLGLQVREARGTRRRRLPRAHFWTMTGIAALAIGHVALNGATIRMFVQ